jgi:integrase
MAVILEEKWPVLGRHERAVEWLRIWADLGRAPRTIDAYARGLAEFLSVCEREGIDPVVANHGQIALFVRELRTRPSRSGPNVVALDSGSGLANATLQQRLVPARLFFDFLVEEGVRESNPVGRGRYTPGRHFGDSQSRSLVPRMVKLPWIPGEADWLRLLEAFRLEPIRNRLMLALAYDSALRREELCSLRTDDLDPAHRTLRVRAETTKTRRGRVVPYSAATGVLLAHYLTHRAEISRARGPLFLSESRRNHGEPLSLWTWSKVVRRIALAVDVPQFSPHHPASVSDRPGANGLGAARDRDLRRAPLDRVNADLHPPLGPGALGEAEPVDDAPARPAHLHADRVRRRLHRSSVSAAVPVVGEANDEQDGWRFPPFVEAHDRRAELTEEERQALAVLGPKALRRNPARGIPRRTATHWKTLAGLVEPLDAARAGLCHGADIRFRRAGAHAAAIILGHCAHTDRSYWAWTATDWVTLCGPSAAAFVAAQPLPTETTVRPFLIEAGLPARRFRRLHAPSWRGARGVGLPQRLVRQAPPARGV